VVAFIIIVTIGIAILITSYTSIIINIVARIDRYYNIIIISPLPIIANIARSLN